MPGTAWLLLNKIGNWSLYSGPCMYFEALAEISLDGNPGRKSLSWHTACPKFNFKFCEGGNFEDGGESSYGMEESLKLLSEQRVLQRSSLVATLRWQGSQSVPLLLFQRGTYFSLIANHLTTIGPEKVFKKYYNRNWATSATNQQYNICNCIKSNFCIGVEGAQFRSATRPLNH